MKKFLAILLSAVLGLSLFYGCDKAEEGNGDAQQPGQGETEQNGGEQNGSGELITLKVGASVTPHAEILNACKDAMAEKGFDLEVVEFTDYVQPNLAVDNGDLDANYFQHQPYLDGFNADHDTDLVSVTAVHYEPFGIYAGKSSDLENVAEGAIIGVPNDGSNEARALKLLEAEGLITLKEGTGFDATVLDIAENPKNLDIREMNAEQLTHSLPDMDFALINGNYALQAGLTSDDALALESEDSDSATTYANVLCVKAGNEENEGVAALVEVLKSDSVKTFIEETYKGSVVPMF